VNETETKAGFKAPVILPASEQEQKNEEMVQNLMVSVYRDLIPSRATSTKRLHF